MEGAMTFEQRLDKILQIYVPLIPQMSREQLVEVGKLYLELKAKLRAGEGLGLMPASAVKAMTDVVDDRLMSDIVNDSRRGVSAPSSLAGPVEPRPSVERGSGWQKPAELGLPPGTKWIDQLCDVQDAIDRRELERKLGGR
jgi:hypothetical protein